MILLRRTGSCQSLTSDGKDQGRRYVDVVLVVFPSEDGKKMCARNAGCLPLNSTASRSWPKVFVPTTSWPSECEARLRSEECVFLIFRKDLTFSGSR